MADHHAGSNQAWSRPIPNLKRKAGVASEKLLTHGVGRELECGLEGAADTDREEEKGWRGRSR